MPYATVRGARIHYEVEGNGPPLTLVHGFTGSTQEWSDFGYVEALSGDYRLIIVDFRGHGGSDKPHDPDAYAVANIVADITGVLDEVGVDRTHLYGYSMGARVGFAVCKYAPDRLASAILGGWAPGASTPEIQQAFLSLLQQGPQAWIDAWDAQGTPIEEPLRGRQLNADFKAYEALWRKRIDEGELLGDALQGFDKPYLLIAGEKDMFYDSIRAYSQQLPAGSLITLDGVNHIDGFQQPELVLPHLTQFLARVP